MNNELPPNKRGRRRALRDMTNDVSKCSVQDDIDGNATKKNCLYPSQPFESNVGSLEQSFVPTISLAGSSSQVCLPSVPVLTQETDQSTTSDDQTDKDSQSTVQTSQTSVPLSQSSHQEVRIPHFSCNDFPAAEYTIPVDAQNLHVITNADNRIYMTMPVDDIDQCDVENHLMVTEYVSRLYNHFTLVERDFMVDPEYMRMQFHIDNEMRVNLIDWMVNTHCRFSLVEETLYTAVSLMDRYLSVNVVRRRALLLVGVACLILASKYEESHFPNVEELVELTGNAYTRESIFKMEANVAIALDYKCTVPTAHTFLCRYLKAAHADRTMVRLASYIAELSLQDVSTHRFCPSTIAAAAVLVSRKTLSRCPWSSTLLRYTGYDEPHLKECVNTLLLLEQQSKPDRAIYKKFSRERYGSVAMANIIG